MKYKILLILFVISLISSGLLAYGGYNNTEVCNPDSQGCSAVSLSDYSTTFGINNNYYGVVIFLFMSILTYSHIKNPKKTKSSIIKLGVTIGTIVSLYFIYLQQFIIQAWCKYCLIVDFSMIVAFGIVFFSWRRKRKWKTR
ncbi:vitamin K epoxide reductase family protein [Candidatus Pacearchaeota archaeon]|nr:vitamin K epoxide reductase family protein [Candidatus Pacearchaeota archaeon]